MIKATLLKTHDDNGKKVIRISGLTFSDNKHGMWLLKSVMETHYKCTTDALIAVDGDVTRYQIQVRGHNATRDIKKCLSDFHYCGLT